MKSIRRPFFRKPNKKFTRVNEQIRIPKVQVVDEAGKSLGVLDTYKAIEIARERGFDLVEIAPKVSPPVCKIIDFGKYKYQQAKKEQERRAKQKIIEVKGIRFGIATSNHDLEHKARRVEEFLNEGNKIKIEIRLRGREKAHQDFAKEKLNSFLKMIAIEYKIEDDVKKTPMGLTMIISKV